MDASEDPLAELYLRTPQAPTPSSSALKRSTPPASDEAGSRGDDVVNGANDDEEPIAEQADLPPVDIAYADALRVLQVVADAHRGAAAHLIDAPTLLKASYEHAVREAKAVKKAHAKAAKADKTRRRSRR